MSYIEKNLMPRERLIYRARLHWIILSRPAFLGIVGMLFAIGAVANERQTFLAFIGVPLILIALLQLAYAFIAFSNWEYGVTNQRVMIKTGILRHKSLEILLGKVEGISVNQPLLGRALGYGSIVISGTGGTRETFLLIDKPDEFRRRVHDQIQNALR